MWTEYEVEVELTEPLLGTVPKDRETYAAWVRTKAPVEDPDETPPDMEEIEEKGWTGFFTDDEGRPVLMDYQVKGFLKEGGDVLREEGVLTYPAIKRHIDNELFVYPRRILLADAVEPEPLERPLRAMTRQGARVALVRSDVIPAGTKFSFSIRVLGKSKLTEEVISDILEYGQAKGFGLGLALAKRIISLHKGRIDVQSDIIAGTIFNITLPSLGLTEV